jgi:hypothetical protein
MSVLHGTIKNIVWLHYQWDYVPWGDKNHPLSIWNDIGAVVFHEHGNEEKSLGCSS